MNEGSRTQVLRNWRGIAMPGVCTAGYIILLLLTRAMFGDVPAVRFLLVAGILNVATLVLWRTPEGKIAAFIFYVAFLIRSVAALVFHRTAGAVNPFAGSPDAWSYHVWGVRIAEAFHRGEFPSITAWNLTGRWDVGYHYVLGLVYFVFGDSILLGRVVGAFFGACAVLMLLVLGRKVASERAALIAALLYAVWPMSIGWSSETILRDSFIWFLLLVAIWLCLGLIRRPSVLKWVGLTAAIVLLRLTRPYAAVFVIGGLGIAFALTLFAREHRRSLLRRSAPFIAMLVVVEAIFAAISFPSVVSTIEAYNVPHWAMRPIPVRAVQLPSTARPSPKPQPSAADQKPSSKPTATTAVGASKSDAPAPAQPGSITVGATVRSSPAEPTPAEVAEASSDRPAATTSVSPEGARPAAGKPSRPRIADLPPPPEATALDAETPSESTSLPGNAVRFLLGPFGWTFYLPGNSTWPVYSMWLWYLILPAAAVGALSLLMTPSTTWRTLVLTCAAYGALLMLIGRGDAFRQREMLVPFVILMAVAGAFRSRSHRRVLIPLYAVWFLALGTVITLHVRSVNQRLVTRTTQLVPITAGRSPIDEKVRCSTPVRARCVRRSIRVIPMRTIATCEAGITLSEVVRST